MRVDFYTLDVRNLGQAEGAHKVGASARTSRKTTETLAFRVESVSDYGVPENACIFGGISVAKHQDNSFDFR